jgi:Ca2+-dependent lipid-binding protein
MPELTPRSDVGIVRLTLHQAKELDQSKTTVGDLNPFARVFLGDSDVPQFSTNKLKHTTAPVWENSTEFLCADKHASVVTVKVVDDRDFLRDPVVGYMSVRLADLLAAGKEAGRDWWPLSGCNSGRVRLSAEWKPLNMAGSLHGADAYRPPIGAVRLHLQKAVDVKNVEATLGGKVRPSQRALRHTADLPYRATRTCACRWRTSLSVARTLSTIVRVCVVLHILALTRRLSRPQPGMGPDHLRAW